MEDHAMPSGIVELEQLYLKPNREKLTSLHCSSTQCSVGYEWVEPSELAVLEQLHVESNSELCEHLSSIPYSQTHTLVSTCLGHTYAYSTYPSLLFRLSVAHAHKSA